MRQSSDRNILFEMLRSYTTLARTLNLSETVRQLQTTRQTVRRHIDTLEEIRGTKFFELKNRQYHLTETGQNALVEAEFIIARGDAWLAGQLEQVRGLQNVKIGEHGKDAQFFYSQQHRLNKLWSSGTPLLRQGFQSWVDAGAFLERKALLPVRPYLIVFRKLEDNWVCVEIGEKSALATWFGWEWARSSVGRLIEKIPAVANYGDFLSEAYNEIFESGGARLDHQHRNVPRTKFGKPVPISFQRLLLACKFPDGEFALGILVDRTYDLEIDSVKQSQIRQMPKELLMDVEFSSKGQ